MKKIKKISQATKKLSHVNAQAEKSTQLEIANLRIIINKLDDMIIQAVARRMIVSRTIGAIKKQHRLPIQDPKREKELRKFHEELAKKHNITYKTLQKIFMLIIAESKKIQK